MKDKLPFNIISEMDGAVQQASANFEKNPSQWQKEEQDEDDESDNTTEVKMQLSKEINKRFKVR